MNTPWDREPRTQLDLSSAPIRAIRGQMTSAKSAVDRGRFMESFDAKRIGAPWGHEPESRKCLQINETTGRFMGKKNCARAASVGGSILLSAVVLRVPLG